MEDSMTTKKGRLIARPREPSNFACCRQAEAQQIASLDDLRRALGSDWASRPAIDALRHAQHVGLLFEAYRGATARVLHLKRPY
jgi:hypothetical protein